MSTSTELTVRKTIEIAVPVEHAWEVFTARMGEWWPGTHSMEPDQFECATITRDWFGETRADGSTASWGSVEAFEPPRRLVVAWLVNPERVHPTRLEVTFAPTETGGTQVELTHTGFEVYDDGADMRSSYNGGWDGVLARYVAFADE